MFLYFDGTFQALKRENDRTDFTVENRDKTTKISKPLTSNSTALTEGDGVSCHEFYLLSGYKR